MRRNDERGQGLVEFALTIPVVLLLMLGLFDLGRIVFINNSLSDGARHGARHAATNARAADYCAKVDEAVRSAIRGQPLTTYTVTYVDIVQADGSVDAEYLVCQDGGDGPDKGALVGLGLRATPGDQVRVELEASVGLALPFIAAATGQSTFDIGAESTMTVTFVP